MFEYESKVFSAMTFGETQDAQWKRLSEETGGEFVPGIRDGWGSQSKVVYRLGFATITLEAFKYRTPREPGNYVMHTRIVAGYLTNDHFSFWVARASYLDRLKSFFNLESRRVIKIGEADLDRQYIFYGSDAAKIRQLFENNNLRQQLRLLDGVSYGIEGGDRWLSKTHRKKSVKLYYYHPHLIYDIRRLRALIELFAETLKQLQRIGSLNYEDRFDR